MTVRVLNADDTVSSITNVQWHGEYIQHLGATGDVKYPAGLWVRKSDVIRHYENINKCRREAMVEPRDLKLVIDNIVCGEAGFEIYDDDSSEEPWLHNGTLCKRVYFGRTGKWWNECA